MVRPMAKMTIMFTEFTIRAAVCNSSGGLDQLEAEIHFMPVLAGVARPRTAVMVRQPTGTPFSWPMEVATPSEWCGRPWCGAEFRDAVEKYVRRHVLSTDDERATLLQALGRDGVLTDVTFVAVDEAHFILPDAACDGW